MSNLRKVTQQPKEIVSEKSLELTVSNRDTLRDLAAFQDRLSRLAGEPDWYRIVRGEPATAGWTPHVDVFENTDGLVIKVDLPGVGKENVQISVEGNVLSVQRERKAAVESKERTYQRAERPVGRFSRSFTLPVDVNTGAVAAGYVDGALTIQIPKRADAKPRTVEIR